MEGGRGETGVGGGEEIPPAGDMGLCSRSFCSLACQLSCLSCFHWRVYLLSKFKSLAGSFNDFCFSVLFVINLEFFLLVFGQCISGVLLIGLGYVV